MDVVRITGFLAIFKCASACALLAHFRSFATYALPKVASRVQIRCFVPYLQPSLTALESYTFISVEHFHGAEMLGEGPQSSLPPQGVVHANVGQNVTPHNPSLGIFLYHFLHTMVSWRHESIHNNTNNEQTPPLWWWSRLPLGGQPGGGVGRGNRSTKSSSNTSNKLVINIFLSTSLILITLPARRQQWWPKRHPLLSAGTWNIRTD